MAQAQAQIGLQISLARLYRLMSAARRRQFFLVLLLMFLGALAEMATIGAVLPFLTRLANSANGAHFPLVAGAMRAIGARTPSEQLIAVTALFILVAIVAGLMRLQLAWSSQSFVYRFGHELGVDIQRRILLQPYAYHIKSNTSTLIAALEKVQVLAFNLLMPLMQAGSAAVLSLFIVAALIYVDPFTAIVAFISFSAIYLLLSLVTRDRLKRNSEALGAAYDERVQIIQESLGGIRDVIIDGTQSVLLDEYRRVDRRLNVARANTSFIGAAPRFVIEAFGMVLIALLANLLAQRSGGIAAMLPVLGALALGAQRLLPLVQQIYAGWTLAIGHGSVTGQVLDLLALPDRARSSGDVEPLPFTKGIALEHVSFAYAGRLARAIEDVSLTIPRGVTIGLIGRTGSGKSTLADLLMGLLEPSCGRITIDGVPLTDATRLRWWRSVAHVPQAIFLSDQSIARNIAFGVPLDKIDMVRLSQAAAKAQLDEFVTTLPEGYETQVGERGIRLSGGQRQRVGLARAIYKQAPVLILDEATSALDDTTETEVMDAVVALGCEGQTIIMIAHRLTTVARCDIVAKLEYGRLVAVGNYVDVVGGERTRATL